MSLSARLQSQPAVLAEQRHAVPQPCYLQRLSAPRSIQTCRVATQSDSLCGRRDGSRYEPAVEQAAGSFERGAAKGITPYPGGADEGLPHLAGGGSGEAALTGARA